MLGIEYRRGVNPNPVKYSIARCQKECGNKWEFLVWSPNELGGPQTVVRVCRPCLEKFIGKVVI